MAKGFRPVERDQVFLLPPDMRDWLEPGHLVWFVLDAVAGLDLSGFVARRRLGGAGRAAYHPQMMVGLLIYAYAVGQRSSRQIERLCHVDVAFRIVCAQDVPDHATIARFRAEHEQALAGLFEQILAMCARAGMGRLGTVALDGTKIAANASRAANRGESRLRTMVEDILAEAAATDAAEDEQFGERRGDELPPELADPAGRAARIKKMLDDIAAEREAKLKDNERAGAALERVRKRGEALQLAREQVEQTHRDHADRLATARAAGRRGLPGGKPVPVEEHLQVRRAKASLAKAQAALSKHTAPPAPGAPGEAKRNLTDPHSRIMKTRNGWIQGYNGQLVVSADYLIVAAALSNDATDVGHYQPMINAAWEHAAAVNAATGADWDIGCVLADAGYASTDNLTAPGPDRLIALGSRRDQAKAAACDPTHGDPTAGASPRERMDHRLRTPDGAALYKRRGAIVEPVNAHLKDRRGLRQFSRRGLTAAASEFRFAAAVTNLLRLNTYLAASTS
jgi:transposase